MRTWFDTEFIEDGHTIDLISIDLVCEDGIAYYAECEECDLSRASDWVKANVIPHLHGGKSVVKRHIIAQEIVRIVGVNPEFWAYYCSYDWVAMFQLFGTMMQLPKHWPMFCNDVKQMCYAMGNPKLPEQRGIEHNALADARWTKEAWEYLARRVK